MPDKLNLAEAHAALLEQWSPSRVAELNDHEVKVAKVQGEFHWYKHRNEDELFLVTKGLLTMQFRDGN